MKLKEKINEVKALIAAALINGEYEFLKCDNHKSTVRILDFELEIWTRSGAEHFDIWGGGEYLVGDLFGNKGDQEAAFNLIVPFMDNYNRLEGKRERLDKIETLKAELDQLETNQK